VHQKPDKFRNNLVNQNNLDEGRQDPDKFKNNSDWSRTTRIKCVKDHACSETTWTSIQTTRHYAAKLRGSPLPQLICFDFGATPGGSDSRTKDQEYKHLRLQQPHDNTSRPFLRVLFWRKEPGEGSAPTGYIPSKKTFKLFLQETLYLLVPISKKLGGYTHQVYLFQQKVHISQNESTQKETISRFPFRRTQNGFATTQQDQEE
jgi:hypothetical protein